MFSGRTITIQRLARAALLGFFLFSLSLSPPAFAELLPIKTYTVADGALRDGAQRIRQDSRGFLWLCSYDGLSRFDGYSFINFTTEDGLPDRHVNDFLDSRSGNYWVATHGGLARLNPRGLRNSPDNSMFTVFLPPAPQSKRINVLHEDDSGIWVGTSDGLYIFDERGEFTQVNLGAVPTGTVVVTTLLRDNRGALWIGTDSHGLFRLLPSGAVEQFGTADGLPTIAVSSLLQDDRGRIWIGMRYLGGGMCRLVDNPAKGRSIVESLVDPSGLNAPWVTSMYQASDGQIWAGTPGGLCRVVDDGELDCDRYKAANNLCDVQTWTITEDKDRNLWIGTNCGTKKWTRYGFTSYQPVDGLAHKSVSALFENAVGELFASSGVPKMPISRFDGEKFNLVTPNFPADASSPGWGWKQTVVEDSQKDWWFATGQGAYRFRDVSRFEDLAKTTPEKMSIQIPDPQIFRLFEDTRGDIWIQTYVTAHPQQNELWRWERATGAWHNHTEQTGISTWRMATAFVEDRHGNLWIATGGDRDEAALIRYRDGRFDVFTREQDDLIAGWLRDLYLDEAGRLWIASNATGVLRLDDVNSSKPEFVRYTAREGLASTGSYCITGDAFGRIYVGSGRGVDRLDPATGQVENFTTADGLPSAEVWTSYRDKNGQLWFSTTQGLSRFVPEPPRVRKAPAVFISGFRVVGEPHPVSIFGESELPIFELASNQRQVTVEFLGVGSSIGEALRYEYRLANSDWTPTEGRSVNFANLSSGEYRLEVRAVTSDRLTSPPVAVSFNIAPPVWQRWWFVAAIGLFMGAAAYVIFKSRVNRLLEIERTRTRIATDLHDDIGSNLSKISLLSEIVSMQMTNGKSESKKMLATIAEISRSSVDSMRDIVWSINPNRDSVLEMTRKMRQHAEDACVPKDILVKFGPDERLSDTKLSMDLRRELFLIFKEAVNNAARHSGCSQVNIDFTARGSEIFLRIADNGTGFDTANISDGNGLDNMKNRAEKLGGRFEVDSNTENGTVIDVRMPI